MPVELQASLFARIVTFERGLARESRDRLTIGVLYQPGYAVSRGTQEQLVRAWRDVHVDLPGRPRIHVVPIAWESARHLEAQLAAHAVDVLYIAPVRALDVRPILALTRARQVLSITGSPELVALGAAVGVRLRGDKPVILVNTAAATLEGATFGSQLLQLAELVR